MSEVRVYIWCHARASRLRSGEGFRVGAPRRRQRREEGVNRGRKIVKTQKSKYPYKLDGPVFARKKPGAVTGVYPIDDSVSLITCARLFPVESRLISLPSILLSSIIALVRTQRSRYRSTPLRIQYFTADIRSRFRPVC